jgi:hypothetical protein
MRIEENRLRDNRVKENAFFDLAERFRNTDEPKEVKQLGEELGRFVFGKL